METTEGNKLIAFFMGAKIGNPVGKTEVLINIPDFWSNKSTSTHATKDLQYHKRWDWLMPVVEKIEACFNEAIIVRINDKRCMIELDTQEAIRMSRDFEVPDCYSGICSSKIEAVCKSVIQFITWYNQTK